MGIRARKAHHHLPVNAEMKLDLDCWSTFLSTENVYNRPFFDFSQVITSEEINLATDASRNPSLGAGGICGSKWFILQWNEDFMMEHEPSIAFLELYAVSIAILLWIHEYRNRSVDLFCDNMSVVHMINNTTSSCKHCMALIRIIVLHTMVHNVRVGAKYVASKDNIYPDLLSRLKYREFRRKSHKEGIKFSGRSENIPEELWPMEKYGINCNLH